MGGKCRGSGGGCGKCSGFVEDCGPDFFIKDSTNKHFEKDTQR